MNIIGDIDALVGSWKGQRPTWDQYFISAAILIASRSTCSRLNVGCVIVSGGEHKNRIIAAGYNGYLPGAPHCSQVRDGHEMATVHAEQNAIADAARRVSKRKHCLHHALPLHKLRKAAHILGH